MLDSPESPDLLPAQSGSTPDFPVTIIVVHPKERRSKCSVEPLRPRTDFQFFTHPEPVTLPTSDYIRLGMGGEVLSEADCHHGLFVLDGTWKLAGKMEPAYQDIPVRTLPAITTAYPRVSKVFKDPLGGLATVEAVYAALRIMRRPVDGILNDYHWAAEFLQLNGWD